MSTPTPSVTAGAASTTTAPDAKVVAESELNARNYDGQTPLMDTVRFRDDKTVAQLIKQRADLNAQDRYGMTALMHTIHYYRPNTVRMLIDAKANLDLQDKQGWTALRHAAGSDLNSLKLLVNSGARLDLKDKEGKTALDFVTEIPYGGAIRVLDGTANRERQYQRIVAMLLSCRANRDRGIIMNSILPLVPIMMSLVDPSKTPPQVFKKLQSSYAAMGIILPGGSASDAMTDDDRLTAGSTPPSLSAAAATVTPKEDSHSSASMRK